MALRHTIKYNQYRGNVRTAAPIVRVASSNDLELWLKISAGSERENLELIIDSAIRQIEQKLGCALITQSYRLSLDSWPMQSEPWWDGVRQMAVSELRAQGKAADIEIPVWPLQSIDSMTVDGATITVSDYFIVGTNQNYGRLVLKRGATWPALTNMSANGILINYTSGFGSSTIDVPADLKLAVMKLSAYMFEHRGDGCSAEKAYDVSGAKEICNMYKLGRL